MDRDLLDHAVIVSLQTDCRASFVCADRRHTADQTPTIGQIEADQVLIYAAAG